MLQQVIDRRLSGKNKSIGNRERFLRRHKDQIREAVKRAVDGRGIRDMEKGEDIHIPRRDITDVRDVVQANGGSIVGEEYFPLDHMDYQGTVDRIMASGAEVVFNTIVPPGVTPFLAALHDAGFAKRGEI